MTARDRTVVIAVLAVVALGAAWLLVVQPKRGTAAKLSHSIQAVQAQLAGLQGQVVADQQARAAFPVDYAELARLGEAVPVDDNVPSLIYELQSAAKASGVDFRGLQLTPSAAPSAGPSPSIAAAAAAATTLPPGVSGGSAGFDAEQFTFSFSGKFFNLSDFLGRLDRFVLTSGSTVQVSGRLMTLNALSLGPGPQGFPDMTANMSATTYLLPASQGLLDGASTAGPGTPPPSGSSAASSPPASGTAPSPGTGAAGTSGATPAPAAAISAAPAITGGIR